MKIVINPSYQYLSEWLNAIPDNFTNIGEIIYDERNTLRKVTTDDGLVLCIKRYRRPIFINRLIYSFFRLPKAQRAYQNALILQSRSINSPTPVAYIICDKSGLITDSYLVTLYCDYEHLMREFTLNYKPELENVIRPFARYTALIHSKDILPTDYSPGNILFRQQGNDYEFSIIDINRMEFKPVGLKEGAYSMRRICANRHFFEVFADEYSHVRGFDNKQFLTALLYYRDRFWNYGKKADYQYD